MSLSPNSFTMALITHMEKTFAHFLTFDLYYQSRDSGFTKWSLMRNNFAADLYTLFTREQDPKLQRIYWVMSMDLKDHLSMHEDEWTFFWGGNARCNPGMKRVLFKKCLQIPWFSRVFVKK